jgi:NADH-quinone oxidoreductase subunit F
LATNTLLALTPDALLDRLATSGLRGRGGGWFEAARKWRAVRVEGGEPFVIANGAEGEPGSHKDRFVMQRRPQDVVAGLALAARAVGAREAVVFLKGSFDRPAAALSSAIAAASLEGLSVEVCRGDDGYISGEETAVLEALEGRKPWPRPKPPLPAAVGFRGRPTLVQNVETLARVPAALGDPEAYRRDETALVTVWGDVHRPGVHEVPLGTPLRRVIDESAGGATEPVGLVFPGGPAGMPLRRSDLDVPLDPESLRAKGTALGTGAILVVGESACPLAVAVSLAGFFERENCAQCPPCAVGTVSLARILRAVESGTSRPRDLRDLSDVAGFMSGHGYCAHCRTAAAVATGMARGFADSVEAHVAGGACPWPERRHPDPFAPGSPERTAVEAAVHEQLR